LTLLVGSFDP